MAERTPPGNKFTWAGMSRNVVFWALVILIPNVFDQFGDFLVIGVTGDDILVVLGWVLVLVAGYASGPKDIPDSVVQGSATAGRAAELLRRRARHG